MVCRSTTASESSIESIISHNDLINVFKDGNIPGAKSIKRTEAHKDSAKYVSEFHFTSFLRWQFSIISEDFMQ